MTANRVMTVALVGGIGSGKSAAAHRFAARGAAVIDADAIGHEALRDPAAQGAIVEQFGEGVLGEDGQVDRRKLGAVVFGEPAKLQELERIVHPLIRKRIMNEIHDARAAGAPLIVLDAAVLMEAGWTELVDRFVFVDAPEEVRRQRVAQRGWSEQEWRRREAAQLPLTRKMENADHVLDNSATPECLAEQVEDLMRQWGCLSSPLTRAQ